jgi:hypothetical protein
MSETTIYIEQRSLDPVPVCTFVCMHNHLELWIVSDPVAGCMDICFLCVCVCVCVCVDVCVGPPGNGMCGSINSQSVSQSVNEVSNDHHKPNNKKQNSSPPTYQKFQQPTSLFPPFPSRCSPQNPPLLKTHKTPPTHPPAPRPKQTHTKTQNTQHARPPIHPLHLFIHIYICGWVVVIRTSCRP